MTLRLNQSNTFDAWFIWLSASCSWMKLENLNTADVWHVFVIEGKWFLFLDFWSFNRLNYVRQKRLRFLNWRFQYLWPYFCAINLRVFLNIPQTLFRLVSQLTASKEDWVWIMIVPLFNQDPSPAHSTHWYWYWALCQTKLKSSFQISFFLNPVSCY